MGQTCALEWGFFTLSLQGQEWDRQYFQKTDGHLHEISAKQPDVWYGLSPTSGFLTEFLLFPPRCFGDKLVQCTEEGATIFWCPAGGEVTSNFSTVGLVHTFQQTPKPDLFSPFMCWITAGLCPVLCPKTFGECEGGDGNGSQKQGMGEVVVTGSLSAGSSNWLGKAVVPILRLLKF